MRTLKIVTIVLAAAFSLVALGQKPPTAASITGVVRDSSGAFLPGVIVTAVGPSGATRAISNESGSFVLPVVQPGTYTVSTSLMGFQGEVSRVSVSTGSPAQVDFRMEIAQLPWPLKPYPGTSNPSIRADRQTRQGTTVQYRGNVLMTTNGMELRADELDYDTSTGGGDVRGNVTFRVVAATVRVIPLSN